MNNIPQIENLLRQVQVKIEHSKEIAKLNGENFNIFSILNLESNENRTHSRFLAELLNPYGSHEMGSRFLEFFLNVIEVKHTDFDFHTATVIVEKTIGVRNDKDKSGGRIDIAMSDKNGINIFIENKIYASDQVAQIERYCNYRTDKSMVYYLSLYGNEPNEKSRGALKSGVHFHCISYRDNIINWLELCTREATDQPILRESIKQYIILIKKLTGQLINDKMKEDVDQIVLSNLKSSEIIAQAFHRIKFKIPYIIRQQLCEKLSSRLPDYSVEALEKIEAFNSKIWFFSNRFSKDVRVCFGIEPFSGNGYYGRDLFIGILDLDSQNENIFKEYYDVAEIYGWWRGAKHFEFEKSKINLSDLEFLQSLSNQPLKLEMLIDSIVEDTITYIKTNENILFKICDIILLNNQTIK